MTEERLRLKNMALLERLQQIVAEYEDRDADRRVELTLMDQTIKDLEQENASLKQAFESQASQTIVAGEVIEEKDEKPSDQTD